ncbi:MAG: DMT family transporter [Prolixibacteraceae bacterium]|nr:DMT family transporter [Prolixibacteraceae bacterium]
MKTKQSEEWKGYVFALVGTIAFSSLYVFSKAGLNQVELAQFGLYYFGLGFLLNLVFVLASGKYRLISGISKNVIGLLVILGVIDILSNITFFMAIRAIPDPSITSFLGNLFPVFMTLLALSFLKERFSMIEAVGALMAIGGAFIISYSGELDWRKFFIPGTGFVVMNTFLAALVSIIVKKNVQKASPEVFNLNSNGWIFLFFLGYFLWSGQSAVIPVKAFQNIALGAFFGSFVGLLSFFYSYRYITASRSSIIQSLKGIFVLIIAYFYLDKFPLAVQLWGGGITIAGVLVMTMAQAGIIRVGKKNGQMV